MLRFLSAQILVAALAVQAAVIARAEPRAADEATAIAIAATLLKPILGEETVHRIEPFTATRDGDDWLVVSQPALAPGIYAGGGAVVVRIKRETGALVEWSTVH